MRPQIGGRGCRFGLAWVLVLLIGVVGGCNGNAPIAIGFVGGTSGRVADAGTSARDAVLMAIAQCNDAGGVDGAAVRLIVRDDKGDPQTAERVVTEFIDLGVAAIIGPITSNIAQAITPITNAARMLMVSPTVATLSEKDDFFFRIAPTTKTYAEKSARFLAETRGIRRIAALYDLGNRAFTENWVDRFRRSFTERGGVLVAAFGFSETSGRTLLDVSRQILATRAECILIVANSMDSALLCQQIRKLDETVAIALSDWGGTERLLELGGNAVEGAIVVQGGNRESRNDRYTAFRRDYMARYHQEPGHTAVNGFDAAVVVLSALRRLQDGQDLRQTILATRSFEGLQGDFSFNRFGDAVRYNTTISVVRNRQFAVLE